MTISLSGQKPAILDPVHTIDPSGIYDPVAAIQDTIVKPLFEPMRSGSAVTMKDAKGNDVDEDDVVGLLMSALGDLVDPDAEQAVKSLLQQGLVDFDKGSPALVNELFVNQAAVANKMPTPDKALYSIPMDVIPSAGNLLGGHASDDGEFFVSLAHVFAPEALGFWFLTADDFNDFKAWVPQYIASFSSTMPAGANTTMKQFLQTDLDGLVEGYSLRAHDGDSNEEYSFARVIVNALMEYQRQNATAWNAAGAHPVGTLPFVVSELYAPRTIVLVNVEAHSRSSARKIHNEWELVKQCIANPVKVISNKALSKLTALPRAMAKAAAQSASAQARFSKGQGRSAKVAFRKIAPSTVDLLDGILRVLKKMKQVNRSHNAIKQVSTSFAKANRRDPADYNRPGKIVSTKFLPDLHIFIDTSGSISEENYQHAVIMLIKLAKKLNVNLYFNSFSNILSQEVVLKTKDKSIAQIWNEFRRVPKVSGGTNFSQIWDYINASPVRQRRLSIVITDFEWTPRTQRAAHPQNLYYAPVSSYDWDLITKYATRYARSMVHIEPNIARRFIGVTA